MVAEAEAQKKSAIAQARRDSVKQIQEANAATRVASDSAIATEQAALDKEKAATLAKGEKEADSIGATADGKIKDVNDFLIKEFERAINAAS
ncbi:MAG: hypothetical protein PHT00_02170 [Candidatus Methanomethylophilus sp.]|nr:hypothetical protein [Methanomethylophilus sp.]MDD4668649.1 hypothetical protein [Methanomethylophilus sp.]